MQNNLSALKKYQFNVTFIQKFSSLSCVDNYLFTQVKKHSCQVKAATIEILEITNKTVLQSWRKTRKSYLNINKFTHGRNEKNMTKLPNLYDFPKYRCQPLIHKIAHLNGREKSVKVLGGLLFLNTLITYIAGPYLSFTENSNMLTI